ncbi:MAG TPA: hypothetical protein PLP50_01940 [Thermoanaerobaculia bacterium]|nr:hypothetical protein [Thermoanaerobaculia bacterium]HQN06484.1 hypothetical protein [Thermoanaerobaculia bacterium]HQP84846.1 hypothetical protein [Thermoanaerobaculia bacterium]
MDEAGAHSLASGRPRPGRVRRLRPLAPLLALLLAAAAEGAAPRPAVVRESWRKVEAGPVTVVGTASDPRLVETAATLAALTALLPEIVPGAFGAPPPLVVALAHEPEHLSRISLPSRAGGRIVLAAAGGEEAREALVRAAVVALARRSRPALPEWAATGLAEYLSTASVSGARATLGRLVPRHVSLLRAAGPPAGRPALFVAPSLSGDGPAAALLRAEAWAVVHDLLHASPDGGERLARHAALLGEGRDAGTAFAEAFGDTERSLLLRARAHAVAGRSLARFLPVASAPPGRVLPLTRTGAAGLLGGAVAKGRPAEEPAANLQEPPAPSSSAARRPSSPSLSRDVPAEVDLVNRLIDAGREEEALARLEALHASLGRDPEMQRALGWDVAEVRRVVVHNRLVRRYNDAIALLNAGRLAEALPIFREVAEKAEDPGLRRLAWERATAPDGGRR